MLLKLAGYGFLRICLDFLPDGSNFFTPLIFTFSILSIIYASFTTLRQIDLKAIVAYGSVGHIAVATIGLFSNTIQGIEGGILVILAHGLVSPALFICVGILYDKFHTRTIKYFRGLVIKMPIFTLFFFLFTLANIGTPLTANFLGEFLCLTGAFQQNPILTFFGSLGIILSAAYSIWLYNRISFGAQSIYLKSIEDLNRREFFLLLPLLFLITLFGLFPNLILNSLHLAISNLLFN